MEPMEMAASILAENEVSFYASTEREPFRAEGQDNPDMSILDRPYTYESCQITENGSSAIWPERPDIKRSITESCTVIGPDLPLSATQNLNWRTSEGHII
jgi:hypothetical protein